jgi:hypothetical protein
MTDKRKYPQELGLMNDCPDCGAKINRQFVEFVIDGIAEQVRQNTLQEVKEMIEGIELDNDDIAGDYSSHDYIAHIAEQNTKNHILNKLEKL